jgi:transposase, IS5 family
MGTPRRQRSRQGELFARSTTAMIALDENHRLVLMTHEVDWTELEEVVQAIRRSKLKSEAGRPPHLRALIGSVLFRATRKMTYRDTEEQIRHYAPARYLCGLTESKWTPDANTIQDFEEQLGEDGTRKLNEYVVKWAVEEKLADPTVVVADTTAQEAAIPHPNEMGLMASFMTAVVAASKKVGPALKGFVEKVAAIFATAKRKVREYRLFAKEKSKAAKDKMVAQMTTVVEKANRMLGDALNDVSAEASASLRKYRKVAWSKLKHLRATMAKLTPQIRYWLRTGYVAANKIVSLHMPELYAIVRGKVGKPVEFGLNWGMTRLRGGFLLATLATDKKALHDQRFAVRAVKDHIARFGKAPRAYAYDRGGWSAGNVEELKRLGVKEIGLAPRGRAHWRVSGKTKERLVSQRAQIEGGIGTVKCPKYGFNKPAARSAATMGACGQRAVLGFNLNKLIRGIAAKRDMVLVG